MRNRQAREHVVDRWKPDSPLRRAAVAALADLEARGVDLQQVYLHGEHMTYQKRPVAAAVGMRWQQVSALVMVLAGQETLEWTEVVRPTRTRPLLALRVTGGRLACDLIVTFARQPSLACSRRMSRMFGPLACSCRVGGASAERGSE